MYTKILYAVDINGDHRKQIEKVNQLASIHQSNVHVIYVVKPVTRIYTYADAHFDDETESEMVKEAEQILHVFLKSYPHISSSVLVGDPTEKIIEHAYDHQYDVIILNGHKHNIFGRMGSVADRVVNHADSDVIILR
jgi:universal stress protein A